VYFVQSSFVYLVILFENLCVLRGLCGEESAFFAKKPRFLLDFCSKYGIIPGLFDKM
jgi:hypothetical protein